MDHFELCIVGAGVVGLAIAARLARTQSENFSIVLLDKNLNVGQETSSRNSEVIHAGIYYPKNSLKARLCREGKALLYEYCQNYSIDHKQTGKLIVAQDGELDALEQIARRAQENGVMDLKELDENALRTMAPLVQGKHGLFSPSTGIVDSHGLMLSLLHQAQSLGVQFAGLTHVERVNRHPKGFEVWAQCGPENDQQSYRFTCTRLVNAAGLEAHQLATQIESLSPSCIPQVRFYKGSYFKLNKRVPLQHLVYPVPEKSEMGLGVHATLDLAGDVRFGPDVEFVTEINYTVNIDKAEQFALSVQRYMPWINSADLVPDYSGVRPKLFSANGAAMDFIIQDHRDHGIPGLVQLFGVESPGLTASLAIARYIEVEIALL